MPDKQFLSLLRENSDWLEARLAGYVRKYGGAVPPAMLRPAPYPAVDGVSAALGEAFTSGAVFDLPPDLDEAPNRDSLVAFGVAEAGRHRACGVSLALVFCLFKCYRRSYHDLVDEKGPAPRRIAEYHQFLDHCFDRMEIGFCADWTGRDEEERIAELQAANRGLADERNAYCALFESLADPVIFIGDDFRIKNLNQAAMDLSPPAAAESGQAGDIPSPVNSPADQVFPWLSAHLLGSGDQVSPPVSGPVNHAGRWFWVSVARFRDAAGGNPGRVIVLHDITARNEMEAELRSSRDMLQKVLDTIPVRVFWKDRDSVYLGCNRLFAQDAGFSDPADILGRTDFDMGWKNEADLYRRDDGQVMASGTPKLGYEEPQTTARGERAWLRTSKVPLLNEKGEIFGVLGTYEDISERKKAEAVIRKNQETMQSMMRAAPLGICFIQDRVFRWATPRMAEITGYSVAELTGAHARMLYFEEEEYNKVGRAYVQFSAGLEAETETLWKKKDGAGVHVFLRGSPIESADPSRGVLVTVLDITARKKAEEERRQLEEQVRHVQKLESLGVLAGGIAHDFNNLLMAILGNAELALMELSPASPARRNILAIETSSRRAAELCRQMLAYSGKGRFVVESLDLNAVVGEMTKMLEVSISKKATLKLNLAPGLPVVEADSTQIRQVVMNLVINASEAIGDEPGIISVVTGVTNCDCQYLAEAYLNEQLPEGKYVYLEVADTGCGMDRETREKMFDPFFTTKFTGRGLGMAAVLGIVRGHSGCIKVYSEPGRGSTIKAFFPAGLAEAGKSGQAGKAAPGWQGSGTVLLVDDDETVRDVGGRMLERLGFSVRTAADGREAVELVAGAGDDIACVLLDLTMPRMDGEEAFREIRRRRPGLKVIMSSGYNEQEVNQRFIGKGLAGFIQKPYRLAELEAVLRRILTEEG